MIPSSRLPAGETVPQATSFVRMRKILERSLCVHSSCPFFSVFITVLCILQKGVMVHVNPFSTRIHLDRTRLTKCKVVKIFLEDTVRLFCLFFRVGLFLTPFLSVIDCRLTVKEDQE